MPSFFPTNNKVTIVKVFIQFYFAADIVDLKNSLKKEIVKYYLSYTVYSEYICKNASKVFSGPF